MNEDDNEIPSGWVAKYYDMNPKIEDMVPSTKDLVVGNVIVSAHPEYRHELPNDTTELEPKIMWSMLERNRWARLCAFWKNEENNVYYGILEFHDGVKRRVVMDRRHAWLVRKDSRIQLGDDVTDKPRTVTLHVTMADKYRQGLKLLLEGQHTILEVSQIIDVRFSDFLEWLQERLAEKD